MLELTCSALHEPNLNLFLTYILKLKIMRVKGAIQFKRCISANINLIFLYARAGVSIRLFLVRVPYLLVENHPEPNNPSHLSLKHKHDLFLKKQTKTFYFL